MDFISVREAAARWRLKPRAVQNLCSAGRIDGARKFERSWMIPADAERPPDQRQKKEKKPLLEPEPLQGPEALQEPEASPAPSLNFSMIYQPFPASFSFRAEDLPGLPEQSAEARLLDALVLYLRGNISLAASQAKELLKEKVCEETALSCLALLAIDALYDGNLPHWNRALERIGSARTAPKLRELMQGLMGASVHTPSMIPEWLMRGDFAGFTDHAMPLVWYVYVKWLYVSKKHEAALYAALPLIAQCRARGAIVAELQLSGLAAAILHTLNDDEAAAVHLNRVLDLSMPHGFIFFFVEHKLELGKLLEGAAKRRDFSAEWPRIRQQSRKLFAGWARLYTALTGQRMSPELTPRELEVLKYAMQNLSIAEIARRMNLAESSVKSYLSNAYNKTGISSRSELRKINFGSGENSEETPAGPRD